MKSPVDMFTSGSSFWRETGIDMPLKLYDIGFTIQVSAAMLGLPLLHWYYLAWQQHEDAGMVVIQVPAERVMRVWTWRPWKRSARKIKGYPFEFPWPPSLLACTEDNA